MEDKKYSVYIHEVKTEDGPMYYVGVTWNVDNRWRPSRYKGCSLEGYIDKYGWKNIDHYIVAQNLTYKEAKRYEDEWIVRYKEIGRCINKQRSGFISIVYEKEQEERRKSRVAEKERIEAEKNAIREEKERIEAEKNAIREEKEKTAYKGGDQKYKEYQLEYMRKKLSTPEGKIYNRVKAYNIRHPDRIIETPLEAKRKYLNSGYIPEYIKNDDL